MALSAVAVAQQQRAVVNQDAPMFLLPDAHREPILMLERGVVIQVIRVEGAWTNIRVEGSRLGDRYGYIETRFLQQPGGAASSSGPSPTPAPSAKSATPTTSTQSPTPSSKGSNNGATTAPASSVASTPVVQPSPPPLQPTPAAVADSAAPIASTTTLSNNAPPRPNPALALNRRSIPLTKGTSVTITVPSALLQYDGYFIRGGTRIVAANISAADDGVAVNDSAEWKLAGLPALVDVSFEKVSKKKNYTEVELRGPIAVVKLRFDGSVRSVESALGEVAIPGNHRSDGVDQYLGEVYDMLSPTFFGGNLAALSTDRKRAILSAVQSAPGGDVRLYKGQPYAYFDLGTDGSVYNDLRFNQVSLIANVLNEQLFTRMRGLSRYFSGVPELPGVTVTYQIRHKSFLEKYAPESIYYLEIYGPMDQMQKFAAADITNQQFLDASVVLVDGNRVQIPLSASGN